MIRERAHECVPWSNKVGYGKDASKENADTADGYIGDTKEGVPATHDAAGSNDDGLGALVGLDREVCEHMSCQKRLYKRSRVNASYSL